MKIRTGFVSNSSTSSFCIMGIAMKKSLKNTELIDAMKIADPSLLKENEEVLERAMREHPYFPPLQTEGQREDEYIYIGLEYVNMQEDETLREFMTRILAYLQKYFSNVVYSDLLWHSDSWYDG